MPTPDAGVPDPHGALAWINAILETLKQAYGTVVYPAAMGLGWWVLHRDKRRDQAKAEAASEEDAHRKISAQLDQESAARFDDMRRENAALRAENTRLIGLRQRWFDRAHGMRHEAGQALQVTFILLQRAGIEPPKIDLPALSYDLDAP